MKHTPCKKLETELDRDTFIGNIFSNKKNEKYKVIGVYNKVGAHKKYICLFLDDNQEVIRKKYQIVHGKVKKDYIESVKCSVCGIENSETRVHYNYREGKYLCLKHASQIERYGKTLNRTIYDSNEIIIKEDHAVIYLYNKKHIKVGEAKIDIEDIERCKPFKWFKTPQNYVCSDSLGKRIWLHRFILEVEAKDMHVDHIGHHDNTTLDNRKINLRACTHIDNMKNQRLRKNNKSGFIGVYFHKAVSKWHANIKLNYEKICLGYYKDKKDAIKARLEGELKHFGEFAPQKHLFEEYGVVMNE